MYGKKVMGVVRTTFIIGPDGKIKHIFHKVKPEGHSEEVLAYLKTHQRRRLSQHEPRRGGRPRRQPGEARQFSPAVERWRALARPPGRGRPGLRSALPSFT